MTTLEHPTAVAASEGTPAPRPAGTARETARVHPPRGGQAVGLLRSTRPRQWVKQVLIAAAPAAAGVLTTPGVLGAVAATMVVFTLACAATYLLNDVLDLARDRMHPVKRYRPIAAGQVRPAVALGTATALATLSLGLAAALGTGVVLSVLAYGALTISYSVWLKHRAVLDLAAVAGGFVLRAVVGGVASGVALSQPFLLVALCGSLVLVTGKRRSEQLAQASTGPSSRGVLRDYPPAFLDQVLTVSAGATLVFYLQWSASLLSDDQTLLAASALPFALALLRLLLLVQRGAAEAPERLLAHDRPAQAAALAWVLLLVVGLYA